MSNELTTSAAATTNHIPPTPKPSMLARFQARNRAWLERSKRNNWPVYLLCRLWFGSHKTAVKWCNERWDGGDNFCLFWGWAWSIAILPAIASAWVIKIVAVQIKRGLGWFLFGPNTNKR